MDEKKEFQSDLDLDFSRDFEDRMPPDEPPASGAFENPPSDSAQSPRSAGAQPSQEPYPPRRRRKRSKWQDFKEAYLPVLILAAALILIISFVVGAVQHKKPQKTDKPGASTSAPLDAEALLAKEQKQLIADADALAAQYDYQGAMAILNSYSAGINNSPELLAKYQEYTDAFNALIPYNDISKIPNLAVRLLIADLPRALADKDYGSQLNNNYLTTSEFSAMLQQLYDNGYMLVSMRDLAPSAADGTGKTGISQGTIYLPKGKKPLVLTQLGVNYFTYLTDGNGDGLPDKDGSGFASRLIIGPDGKLTNEMVDAEGQTVTGAFDLVTILDSFLETHPDFSYRGARATLAVTGYDGLFGYRTDPETEKKISKEFYEEQLRDVKPVIEKLRSEGYDFACMSYDYMNYGEKKAPEIQADLDLWMAEVKPLLGDVDILVLPYGDIGDRNLYTGPRFDTLSGNGFHYFMAKDSATPSWGQISGSYARMTFREAGGRNLYKFPNWYQDLFDASKVLDPARSFN